MERGRIFNIQKYSTEDGPGIRTTVFMKGCPLRCLCCHNPEGLLLQLQLVWYDNRCKGFMDCIKACPKDALELTSKGMIIKRDLCDGCGDCADVCPANALEIVGRDISLEKLLKIVDKDRVFYEKSGGGVTFSGGECLAQPDFIIEATKLLSENDISVAIDTSGYAKKSILEQLIPYVNLFLCDLKLIDRERHKSFTGVYPDLIWENAKFLSQEKKRIWIRTSIIAGYTDDEENIKGIAQFIEKYLPGVERYDLLSFNNLCIRDYERLGMDFQLKDLPLISRKKMEELKQVAEGEGLKKVTISGLMEERKNGD